MTLMNGNSNIVIEIIKGKNINDNIPSCYIKVYKRTMEIVTRYQNVKEGMSSEEQRSTAERENVHKIKA